MVERAKCTHNYFAIAVPSMILAEVEYLSSTVVIVTRLGWGDNNRCNCPRRTDVGRTITRPRDETPPEPNVPVPLPHVVLPSLSLTFPLRVIPQRPDPRKGRKDNAASLCILTPLFFHLIIVHFNMSRPTLNLLRFATSSLRTPTVSRSYYHSHRTAAICSRTYSSTAPENTKETPEGSGDVQTKAEDKLDRVPPLSELEAKLQAKEAEVLDLTVRQSRRLPYTSV